PFGSTAKALFRPETPKTEDAEPAMDPASRKAYRRGRGSNRSAGAALRPAASAGLPRGGVADGAARLHRGIAPGAGGRAGGAGAAHGAPRRPGAGALR